MNRAYLVAAARNAGVPEMWVDDAAQDIAIRIWRGRTRSASLDIRHGARNARDRYGTFRRRTDQRSDTIRPTTVLLPETIETPGDPYAIVDMLIDVRAAIAQLPPRQLEAVRRRCAGLPLGDTMRRYLADAVPKLRAALAA